MKSTQTIFSNEQKTVGIYCYEDCLNDDEIVYIGKDSNISKNKRHKQHLSPSLRNEQPFNSILQDNPGRYNYKVLTTWADTHNKNHINQLEMAYIEKYNPKFNFTKGGDGFSKGHTPWNKGIPHSDEIKKKLSENHWDCKKENNPNWKDYSRLKKAGKATDKNKTQRYAIVKNGKPVKRSVDIDFLLNWFEENYPNEPLIDEGGLIQ